MSVHLALIAIFSLMWAIPSGAAPMSGASACGMIGATKVTVTGLNKIIGKSDGTFDLCALPSLDDSQIRFFFRLNEIHRKGHELFGFAAGESYESARAKLEIHLSGGPLGTLVSDSDIDAGKLSRPTIGMFEDATLEDFPYAAYAHEYGHILQASISPTMPLLPAIGRNFLLDEALPDLFAREVMRLGDQMPSEGFPPRLMAAMREWNERQTFHQPANTFGDSYDVLTLQQRCARLSQTSLDEKERSVCDLIKRAETSDSGMPSDKSFVEYIASNGPEEAYADPHRIGIPIASFFVELENQTGIPAFQLLVDSLRDSVERHNRGLSCSLRLPNGVTLNGSTSYVSSEALFQNLEVKLRARGKSEVLGALRRKYGLDAAIRMGDNEVLRIRRLQILRESSGRAQERGLISKELMMSLFDDRDRYQKEMQCNQEPSISDKASAERLNPLHSRQKRVKPERPSAIDAAICLPPEPEHDLVFLVKQLRDIRNKDLDSSTRDSAASQHFTASDPNRLLR